MLVPNPSLGHANWSYVCAKENVSGKCTSEIYPVAFPSSIFFGIFFASLSKFLLVDMRFG